MSLRDRLRRAARRAFDRTTHLVEPLFARKICPTCHQRSLEPDPELVPSNEGYVAGYRCRSCAGQWRSLEHGPLIPVSAWDAGVRDDGTVSTPLARSLWRVAKRATAVFEPLLARKVCPACHERMLEPDPEQVTEQLGSSHVAAYRCRGCSGQWRSLDNGELISRADWDDGVRGSTMPTATARPKR
jgi:RNase P subunit RPR2